ncbi:MAG: hypothetical protein EXR47_03400 [Dehalococcoidia bacterium]|nr:hypothetical protein [Dehalococcoidia bacterium]
MNDGLFTVGELVERQVYWRSPLLVRLLSKIRRARRGRQVAPTSPKALEEGLQAIVPSGHRLLMVHSAVSGIALSTEQDSSQRLNSLNTAEAVLNMLTRLAGPRGTLVMPTHPAYEGDPGFMHDKSRLVLTYDPARSPSTVGLITEVFRRCPGTLRSLHRLWKVLCAVPHFSCRLHQACPRRDLRPVPGAVLGDGRRLRRRAEDRRAGPGPPAGDVGCERDAGRAHGTGDR